MNWKIAIPAVAAVTLALGLAVASPSAAVVPHGAGSTHVVPRGLSVLPHG